jgi:LysM repeat protein
MKKRVNKHVRLLLVFSALLFSTAIYFLSSSLILGASPGGSAPITTTNSSETTPSTPAPSSEAVEDGQTPAATTEQTATAEGNSNTQEPEVYVVKSGQTLWEIAQDSGLSIQTLMNKNQLSSSVLVEGQELVFDN